MALPLKQKLSVELQCSPHVRARATAAYRSRREQRCVSCTASTDRVSNDITVQSSCPFAGTAAYIAVRPSNELSQTQSTKLQGSGWTVLPEGNVNDLPQPQSKQSWSLNPLRLVLGDFPDLQNGGELPFLLKRFKLFGPVFKWQFGTDTVVAVLQHDIIKSLLQHGDGKVIRFWSPPALSAANSEETKRQMEDPAARIAQRKTLAPGFSRQALRQVLGKVEAICRRKLDSWAAVGSAVDLTAEGRELSFDFSTELLVNFNVPEEQRATVKQQLDAMFKAMLAPPLNLPGSIFWKGQRARQQLIQDLVQIIEASDSSSSSSSTGNKSDSSPDVDGVGTSAFELILQSLREQQSKDGHLSAETIAQSGISLLLAGTDTSGGGVTALMEMVALFPDVMQKLRQEQQQVIAQYGTTLSLRALDAMPYAEAVIKEALRLAPPAGAVLRRTLVDLEIAGHFVPAGTLLYLSTFTAATLTDPSLTGRQDFLESLADGDLDQLAASWKQVGFNLLQQEFKPDRWLQQPQAGAGKPSGLLTFSVGPHTCLGMSLFMTEAKVLLALLSREYELQPEAPQEASFTFTMLAQLTANAGSRVRFVKLQGVADGADGGAGHRAMGQQLSAGALA